MPRRKQLPALRCACPKKRKWISASTRESETRFSAERTAHHHNGTMWSQYPWWRAVCVVVQHDGAPPLRARARDFQRILFPRDGATRQARAMSQRVGATQVVINGCRFYFRAPREALAPLARRLCGPRARHAGHARQLRVGHEWYQHLAEPVHGPFILGQGICRSRQI